MCRGWSDRELGGIIRWVTPKSLRVRQLANLKTSTWTAQAQISIAVLGSNYLWIRDLPTLFLFERNCALAARLH